MKLNVSEVFYSIQGEGVTMGTPSVFLRLGGCNLLCKGKGWVCDTIAVWQKSVATEFENVIPIEWVKRLSYGAHLVITGGEPLMHQEQLIKFIEWFGGRYNFFPYIEVETNGTIVPDHRLSQNVDRWNVSPKLNNSGETFERRHNELALRCFNNLTSCFKFVICSEGDVLEVLQDFKGLDFKKVVLMPGGDTQELLNITRPIVAEECIRLGVKYCDRLHIVIWNQKTGV
jgi:organic radical activating enzyme